jgi:tetratricopeptide (TPR) repeat protein
MLKLERGTDMPDSLDQLCTESRMVTRNVTPSAYPLPMGFRMRKSIKIMPGVRVTLSPRGVSTSVGVRGARMTLGSTGRVTSTLGIPGSGMSYTKTVGHVGGSSRSSSSSAKKQSYTSSDTATIMAATPKPGLFASKGERELAQLVSSDNVAELARVASTYPEAWAAASTLLALHLVGLQRYDDAEETFAQLLKGKPEVDPLFTKYFRALHASVSIAEGVQGSFPFGRTLIELAYAEVLQMNNKVDEAIHLVEGLEPTQWTALSLADLYYYAKRWDDIIELVTTINNVDDVTALLIMLKGCAYRENGNFDAAKECFKIALKSSKRDRQVLNRALLERAECYRIQKQYAFARRDAEKIMVADPHYPPLKEFLEKLDSEAPRKKDEPALEPEADHESHDDSTDAGWQPDPKGRHELRFFNGTEWTEFVSDKGVPGSDPL